MLYYVGCQTVYIVGMDHSYAQAGRPNERQIWQGRDVNHFDDKYFSGQEWHTADLQNNEKYYEIARRQYLRDGRRIIDATVGGKCEVFEKADYLTELYRRSA